MGRSEHLDDIASTAIREVSEHLRASRAALIVWDDRPGVIAASAGDPDLISIMPTDSTDPTWAQVASPDRIDVVDSSSTGGRSHDAWPPSRWAKR